MEMRAALRIPWESNREHGTLLTAGLQHLKASGLRFTTGSNPAGGRTLICHWSHPKSTKEKELRPTTELKQEALCRAHHTITKPLQSDDRRLLAKRGHSSALLLSPSSSQSSSPLLPRSLSPKAGESGAFQRCPRVQAQ